MALWYRDCERCGKQFEQAPLPNGYPASSARCAECAVYRICERCGEEFQREPRRARYCGQCGFHGKMQYGKRMRKMCRELAPVDASYLAGFFDGEGTVCIYQRGNPIQRLLETVIAIGNTNREVIEWVVAVTGLARPIHIVPKETRHKDSYYWRVPGSAGVSVIRQIWPYLRVKKAVAALLLEVDRVCREEPRLSWDPEWQERIKGECRRLNARGAPERHNTGKIAATA